MKHAASLLALFTLAYAHVALAGDEIALSAQQIQALGIVSAALPNKQSGEVSGLPAQVVVPGNQLFVISTPLPAMVEQTLVGVGDSVSKGETIALLQSPALAEAQRGLLQASVQSQLAQENLSRDEALLKDGIISESRFRATRGVASDAHAALAERKQMLRLSGMTDAAIAQLQSGGNLTSLMTVISPIDGVVLEKTASAGQRLDAAVPIFKIAQLAPLALEIQAPLALTHRLKTGAAISIPAFNASGKITAIGSSLTSGSQSIMLRGLVYNGAERLRPNQFVEVSISTTTGSGAQWEVPNSAIARISGRAQLFVQTPRGFRTVAIQVLNEGAQNSVITGTLNGNEKIAVQGVSGLKASAMGIGGAE